MSSFRPSSKPNPKPLRAIATGCGHSRLPIPLRHIHVRINRNSKRCGDISSKCCKLPNFIREKFGVTSNDVVMQIPSLSFDASVRDLIGSIVAGARCVLLDGSRRQDSEYIATVIEVCCVTSILSITRAFLKYFS
ncbi:AMP-binding protein (plasmid) [Roseibium aggregatum]|nr:AMP-binding protein [Roseibium aggregatum]